MGQYQMHQIIGHAIVSADGFIADSEGRMPKPLMIEADWDRFQAELDASDVTLLGRLGHEAHPNFKLRRRLVLTSGVDGLRTGENVKGRVDFLNPAGLSLKQALDHLFLSGTRIAVVGGTKVFDHVLSTTGFDVFDLVVANEVMLGAGNSCFTKQITSPRQFLKNQGYREQPPEMLDVARNVTLHSFVKS
jgi:dihydrofolate reductase